MDLVKEGRFGDMVAIEGNRTVAVPLEKVAGRTKKVDLELDDLSKARTKKVATRNGM